MSRFAGGWRGRAGSVMTPVTGSNRGHHWPRSPGRVGLLEMERLFQAGQCFFAAWTIDHDAQAYLTRVDHADIDAAFRQSAEHTSGHPRVRAHADPKHDHPGEVAVSLHSRRRIDRVDHRLRQLERL